MFVARPRSAANAELPRKCQCEGREGGEAKEIRDSYARVMAAMLLLEVWLSGREIISSSCSRAFADANWEFRMGPGARRFLVAQSRVTDRRGRQLLRTRHVSGILNIYHEGKLLPLNRVQKGEL